MAKYEGGDRYLDPQTGVLRNRLGIADERRLEAAEASLVAWRSYELSQKPLAGDFDFHTAGYKPSPLGGTALA